MPTLGVGACLLVEVMAGRLHKAPAAVGGAPASILVVLLCVVLGGGGGGGGGTGLPLRGLGATGLRVGRLVVVLPREGFAIWPLPGATC